MYIDGIPQCIDSYRDRNFTNKKSVAQNKDMFLIFKKFLKINYSDYRADNGIIT